jgi:hypothetical protein
MSSEHFSPVAPRVSVLAAMRLRQELADTGVYLHLRLP